MCCIEFLCWVFLCCVWQSWQRSKENTSYVDSTQINTNSYKNNQVQAQSIFNEWMIVWILHIIVNLNRGWKDFIFHWRFCVLFVVCCLGSFRAVIWALLIEDIGRLFGHFYRPTFIKIKNKRKNVSIDFRHHSLRRRNTNEYVDIKGSTRPFYHH